MQAEAEEEAEAEQCGLTQQLRDMRDELNDLRASCSRAEREATDERAARRLAEAGVARRDYELEERAAASASRRGL
jgi:hypothetical protein